MSKSSKNKKLLNEMQSPRVEVKNEEIVETKINSNTASRSFKCPDCGWEVILSGTVASDKSIVKCSKCSVK